MKEFITVFRETLKSIVLSEDMWLSIFVVLGVWMLGYFVSCLVSLKSDVMPGRLYRLRYNIFVDRYSLHGKLISRGEVLVVCVVSNDPNGSRCRFVSAYLKPAFLHWGLYDSETDERIDARISGLYACLPGEVPYA